MMKALWSLLILGHFLSPLVCAEDGQTASEDTEEFQLQEIVPTTHEMVRLVSFQASTAASTNSSLQRLPEFPSLSAITLNLWARFRHFSTAVDTMVSYFFNNDDLIQFWHDWKSKELLFRIYGYRLVIPVRFPLYTWIHISITFDLPSGVYHVAINGQAVPSSLTVDYEHRAGKTLPGGGVLVLGQDQDSPGGDYSVTQAFSGDLADFCLYFESFPEAVVQNFECFAVNGSRKPISLHSLDDWHLIGDVEALFIDRELLDPEAKEPFILLPERKYFSEALRLCQVLGLPMALPKSAAENNHLFVRSVEIESFCISAWSTNVWIGARANLSTKEWQSVSDSSPLTYDNLDEAYSIILETRQCITMGSSLYPEIWYNTACSKYTPCPACENSPINSIQVRGLCKKSQFDPDLHIHGTMNFKPVFHGTYYTKVWWDNTTWVMTSRLLPKLKAKMVLEEPDDYPVGLHQWRVSGDECPAEKVDLLLTVCGEESFPCNDGTCVHMSQRCDLRAHCDDGSDEIKCDKVFVGTDYEKTLPPPPPETEDVLNITMSVEVTAVRTLNLLDQTVTLDVQLMSQWEDSRLNYADLHPVQYRNQIQNSDRLWKPRLIITDEAGSLVDLTERGVSLIVLQGSDPLPSDNTKVIKAIVFPGLGNPLLLRQELSITFQCQFDLLWFPFDNQRCSINFRLNDVESKLVRMIASEPQYLGPEKLLEYQVRRITLKEKEQGGSGQKLTMVFTNMFRYYLANSYLPSFLLVVISYSTFYFRLEDFNERIMVSITAMLVLVALFQQTSSTILKTTYLKLIDVWYMVCIVVDFVMVILLVVIDFARHFDANTVKIVPLSKGSKPQYYKDDKSKKYNLMARLMLPTVFLIFIVIYGVIAAVQYLAT